MELLFKHKTSGEKITVVIPHGFTRVKPEPTVFKVGRYYRSTNAGSGDYILAQVAESKVALVAIGKFGGNRFANPVPVESITLLTPMEAELVTNNKAEEFQEVPAEQLFK